MRNELILKQGEDEKIIVRLKTENGTPVDLATIGNVQNIQVAVMVGNQPQGTYELQPTGANPLSALELVQDEKNAFALKIERAQSKTFPIGLLKANVRVIWNDNDFPNGRSEEFEVIIGKVIVGHTKDLQP